MSRTSSSSGSCTRLTVQEVNALIGELFPSKDAEVVDFQLSPFSAEKLGYLGVHELLSVEVRTRDETSKTLTFFAKSVAPSCNAFDQLIFHEESKFFSDVVPELLQGYKAEPWMAKCYMVRNDLLVLEDLRSHGFKVTSEPLQVAQLRSAVVSLARFHASTMSLEEKLRTPLSDVYPGFFKEKVFLNDDGGFAWKWLLTGIEVVEAVARKLELDPKFSSTAYELMLQKIKPVEGQRNVLCHSDLWSNNLMFKDEEDGTSSSCRLVDFQMVSYTSYAVDLVQLIHLNSTGYPTKNMEKDLVELYHSVVVENLRSRGLDDSRIIGLEEVFRDLENKRICGLVSAVQFFPIALLNKELTAEYTNDVEKLEAYMYTSRKDFVLRAMTLDKSYRDRVEESVRVLIEFMKNNKIQA